MLERIRTMIALALIEAGARILPPPPERTPEQESALRDRVMIEIMMEDCHERRNGHDTNH